MKHFVGGFGLGAFVGLLGLAASDDKPLQVLVVALLLGMAAWGLLP